MTWYYVNFDSRWCTCRGCKRKYFRENIKNKRKCPNCKMDNKGCCKEAQ